MSIIDINIFAKVHNVNFDNYAEARKENQAKVARLCSARIKAGLITNSNDEEVGFYCFLQKAKNGFSIPVFIQKDKYVIYMEVIQKVENGFSYIICGRDGHKLPKYFKKDNGNVSFVFRFNDEFATVVVYLKGNTTMVEIKSHYLVKEGLQTYVESEDIWTSDLYEFETNTWAPFNQFHDAVTTANKNLTSNKPIIYGG